jgi:hypothetical protein
VEKNGFGCPKFFLKKTDDVPFLAILTAMVQ